MKKEGEIKVVFKSNLYYTKVQIVLSETGWSQILKDNVWINHRFETTENVIIEIGKAFDSEKEAVKFTETKGFKQLLKLVQKRDLI
jgi:hypothetical protein